MPEIRFKCGHCNMELGAPPGTGGKFTHCPKCGKEVRIPHESTPGVDLAGTATEMTGLLVGVDFLPNGSEFETLLKNGDLIPGLQYSAIELTRQEAGDEKYLTTMFQGAAVQQGWLEGAHTKPAIKQAEVNGKPVVIVYPSAASSDPLQASAAGEAVKETQAKKKWWQLW